MTDTKSQSLAEYYKNIATLRKPLKIKEKWENAKKGVLDHIGKISEDGETECTLDEGLVSGYEKELKSYLTENGFAVMGGRGELYVCWENAPYKCEDDSDSDAVRRVEAPYRQGEDKLPSVGEDE